MAICNDCNDIYFYKFYNKCAMYYEKAAMKYNFINIRTMRLKYKRLGYNKNIVI